MVKHLIAKVTSHKKLLKFGVTGVGATLVHIIIASILIVGLNTSTQLGNGVAFVVATCFSYVVNTLWSFSNGISSQNALKFLVVSIGGLALTILISLIGDSLHLHYLVGIAMITATVPIYTYVAHSRWTYR